MILKFKYYFKELMLFYILTFIGFTISAQNEFYNNGSAIAIQTGGLIYVQGEVVNNNVGASIGLIDNKGNIDFRDNWINNSTSGALLPTTGTVTMYGANQRIQGTQSSKFNTLILNGSGIKTLDVNTYVGGTTGILNLTSLPLDLNSNTLIITNQVNTAIARTTGYIISETAPIPGYGNVQWDLQNSTGNYTIPFGVTAAQYIPLDLNITTAGVQSSIGGIIASTYPTTTAPAINNRPLPTGVLDLNNNCNTEHAIKMLDRFWVVNTNNYITNPNTAKNFTYRDSEWDLSAGSSNNITESQLQSWHYVAGWNAIAGAGSVALNNYAIPSANDYGVFTLGEYKVLNATLLNIDSVKCFGQSNGLIQFTSNHGYGSPTYSYNATLSTDTLNNTLAAGVYTVTITDIMGCKDTLNALNVYEPTQLTLTLSASNTTICVNDTTQLKAIYNGGTLPYNLNWNPGIIYAGVTTLTSNVTYSPIANTQYSLTLTDYNGCTLTNSINITVNPLPIIDFNANPTSGCMPLLVNFNNTSALAPPIVSWAWNFGDGSSSVLQDPIYTYTTSGLFNVTLQATSDKGCISKLVKNNYIDVFSLPIANFIYAPITADYLNPEVVFNNTSTNAGNSVSWDFGGGTIITGNNYPSYSYDDAGTYTVQLTVTNSHNCRDSITLPVIINDISTFYIPNAFTPNGDALNNTFIPLSTNITEFSMQIFDRWGSLVFQSNDILTGWDGTYKGVLSKSDVYVYKISYRGLYNRKVAKSITGHVTLLR